MAKIIEAHNPHAAWATMNVRSIATIFFSGLLVGVVTYLLSLLLNQLIFEPILCRQGAPLARCESSDAIAAGTAMIVASFLGLTLLVRERVYRPIMAVLGVVVSLWGVLGLASALPPVAGFIVVVLLFGLAYVLFAWIVQAFNLWVSIAGVAIVAVLARLIIS